MINFTYFDKDKFICKFHGHGYFRYECEPGEHIFWAKSEIRDFITADLEAGKIYFVEADAKMGGLKARVELVPVNPTQDGKLMNIIEYMVNKREPETFAADCDEAFAQMLDLSRPNSHHQVLGSIAGKWAFQDAKLAFVKGTIIRKPLYDGRFYTVEITGGKLQVPIADGKMKEDNYRGLQIEGYDNGRNGFVSTSINNHIGSDVEMQMGTYDSTSKTITYFGESELIRGLKINTKKTLKIINANQYTEEYYEQRDGQFVKVRELDYTKLGEN